MRASKGMPFDDVRADFPPKDWPQGKNEPPVFSEAFLYPTVGKGDARFILGIAEEYEHIIRALGPRTVRLILDVKPRLVQRLGVPKAIRKRLKDAQSWENEQRERRRPSQVILDGDAAYSLWQELHEEYRRFFNPEEDMDREKLRAYNTLTESLGNLEVEARQKERDRLPEKLEQQEKRRVELKERKKIREDKRERILRVLQGSLAGDGTIFADRLDTVAGDIERELRDGKR